jgi:hypothetical protein
MKVFAVIECGYYSVNNMCNILGVHTSLEKAKEEMLECHKQAIESVNRKEFVSNISSYAVDMECAIFYKNEVEYVIEQHFVSIVEREIEE